MTKYIEILKKHKLSFSREVFYVLLNCIDSSIDTLEDLISSYKDEVNYTEIKKDYTDFYNFMRNYFNSMDIEKDMIFHNDIMNLVDLILDDDTSELQKELKMFISNIIDMIFIKYKLNITKFNTNEEIKYYFVKKIKSEKIVNLLVLLLLADTSLSNKDLDEIPEEEFENIISSMILISIYICKGAK